MNDEADRRNDRGGAPAAGREDDYGRARYPEAASVLHDEDGYDDFFDFDTNPRDFVRIPRRAPQVPAFLGWRLVAKLAVLALLAFAGLWAYHQVNPSGEPGPAVIIDVAPGATTAAIADVLDDAGVISSSRLFQEYARFKSKGLIKAGSYQMQKNMALWEALDLLNEGPVAVGFTNVTVPEGLRVEDIRATIAAAVPRMTDATLAAALDSGQVVSAYQPPGTTVEGFLFPDTYRVETTMTEVQALSQMTAQFDKVAGEIDLKGRAAALGYTPYQIVTIASMIEAEAKVPEERAKIARVIYNRLEQDIRLDIDATTLYAVGKKGNTLTQSDLDSDSPYNTRKASGLPPGPISAPGRASLEAALNPATGPWLFYVLADADGHHAFTDDAGEFDRLVAQAEDKGLLG